MDLYEALQAKAMLAVVKPTRESWYRSVCRWYSHYFSTPLTQVYDLPVDDVLLAYYEQAFEDMDDDEREEHIERLTETPEERAEREKAEAESERAGEDFFETLNRQVEADMAAGKPVLKLGNRKRSKEKLPGKLSSFSVDQAQVSGNASPAPESDTGLTTPPESDTEGPLIDLRFDDLPDGNLQGEDPLGATRRKP